jgi:hypothetical protein
MRWLLRRHFCVIGQLFRERRGWGQTKVRRDWFVIILVSVGFGFVAYTLLSLKAQQPNISENTSKVQLVTDPGAVLPQILAALDEKVSVKDGLILITGAPNTETYLMPASAEWLVRCGAGAAIRLGTAGSGSQGLAESGVDISLFRNPIDKRACAEVAPRVAARLQEKLAGW